MKVELKNVKSYPTMGMEGGAWEATLYIDGERVATVQDSGDGGGAWPRAYGPREKFAEQNAKLKEFSEWCKTQPVPEDWGMPDEMHSTDSFLGCLFEQWDEEKQIKKWAKKAVVFRVKGDPDGEYRQAKPRNEKVMAWVKSNYGDLLEKVW